MYALIDCNNFYASCERLFRPDLRDKPIIVLSSNDGCIIARSNEAKALGIKMGVPYFKIKGLCKQHQVQVFSSNFTLYGDISHRVMSIIQSAWPEIEIYSVDEAFLDVSSLPLEQREHFLISLQKRLLKEIGIPTSIGIGPTKTLAKLANHICKKELNVPVFDISYARQWLKKINIGDVWGIGHRWHATLVQRGIYTAYDLALQNPHLLKKQYNVVMMRTAMELQGIPCHGLEDTESRQSIISSKSFDQMQTSYESLAQAISGHCVTAWGKLRQQGLVARYVTVFVQTNRFRDDLPQYAQPRQFRLINPSDDLMLIIKIAKHCLKQLVQPDYKFKKIGLCLGELEPKNPQQLDFFNQCSLEEEQKKEQLMHVFTAINKKYGRNTIRLAAQGYNQALIARAELRSPAYTTRWSDLPVVKNRT